MDKLHGFVLDGYFSSDGKPFLARFEAIDSYDDLSLTERRGLKKIYVKREKLTSVLKQQITHKTYLS